MTMAKYVFVETYHETEHREELLSVKHEIRFNAQIPENRVGGSVDWLADRLEATFPGGERVGLEVTGLAPGKLAMVDALVDLGVLG